MKHRHCLQMKFTCVVVTCCITYLFVAVFKIGSGDVTDVTSFCYKATTTSAVNSACANVLIVDDF